MAMVRRVLVTVLFHVVCASSPTNRFGRHADPFLGKVVATRAGVQRQVEDVLTSRYRADTSERLKSLEDDLRPTFVAMPKTERGYLGAAATRQLLHRHFLRARAWLVKGLAPDGNHWNSSSPVAVLDASAGQVKDLFEQRLGARGLDLPEVALLAAMVENQVHQDAVARLREAWRAEQLPESGTVSLTDMEQVLDAYMTSYIIHAKGGLRPTNVKRLLREVGIVYPAWSKTQSFVRAILRRAAPHGRRQLNFSDAESMVVEISEHYGRFQFAECHNLKMDLLAIEGSQPGRVALRDFFGEAIRADKYQFGESVAYMRHTGILDETSDPQNPSLVIPNYIESPSQYIADSDAYALTCQDECEQLMLRIEQQTAAPYASPERIAAVVASLPSDTQPERTSGLPDMLLLRLHQIARADSRDGSHLVALHGRLFAQWLHHAFPRECPYPHVAGQGVEFLIPTEFDKKFGKSAAYASPNEMHEYAEKPPATQFDVNEGVDLPWDETEALLAPKVVPIYPMLPTFLVPWFHAASCLTMLAVLVPNLAMLQGLRGAGKVGGGFPVEVPAQGSESCVAS